MPLKIYLNDQIHRVSKLPETLDALISLIKTLFQGYLPPSWIIHYMDEDGDSITVSHEHDYKEVANQESKVPNQTIKLYIVASELGNSQRSQRSERQEEEKRHGEFRRPREFGEAKHLMKKLMKGDLSDSERIEITRRLEEVKESFTSEERARFEAKRQRFEQKRGWKKGQFGEGEERPGLFDRFKMMLGWKSGGNGHGNHKGHHGRGDGFSKFGMLSEIKAKIEKQTPEKAPVIFKSVENFVKFFKAKKHGKNEKAKEYQAELINSLPVENRKEFEELLSAISGDLSKHELKESLISVAKMYYQIYCPENNNIFEELEEMRKERKAKKTLFKHMKKNRRGVSPCGGLDWEKEQELKKKYSKFTLRTALTMKYRLPEEDVEKLCEFVKQSPYDLSFEQLLENYNVKHSKKNL